MSFEHPPVDDVSVSINLSEQGEKSLSPFFELHAQTIVEIGGARGTISELIALCPIDPKDMDPVEKDRFCAKVLKKAGHEIPEEYGYLLEPLPKTSEQDKPTSSQKPENYSHKENKITKQLNNEKTVIANKFSASNEVEFARLVSLVEPPVEMLRRQETVQQTIATKPEQIKKGVDEPKIFTPKAKKAANKREFGNKALVSEFSPSPPKVLTPSIESIETEPKSKTLPQEPTVKSLEVPSTFKTPHAEQHKIVLLPELPVHDIKPPKIIMHELPGITVVPPLEIQESTKDTMYVSDWVEDQDHKGQEDTVWVDNLFQARMSEVEASEAEPEEVEAPTAEEVIVADIGERLEVSEEVVEQVETLVTQVPEEVGERLAEFIADEENEPEVVAATEELVVRIAQVADRLHELAMTEQLESQEAEQIQEMLREWYAELLTTLELPVDEEVLAAFIELVCSEAYEAKSQTDEEGSLETQFDIFKERKPGLAFDLSAIMGGVTRIEHRLEHEIARLMVRRSTAAITA